MRLLAVLTALCGSIAVPAAADFPLVHAGRAAVLVIAPEDHEVVRLAGDDLARDIAAVTGVTPAHAGRLPEAAAPAVVIGTLGRSPALDRLVESGRLDVSDLRGAWESFVIAALPAGPDTPPLLVIAGSDRRGTAFGVYELSQQIGVSPWHWWADVAPERREELTVPAGTRRFGPPSVRYRGIFINDEDWSLQPWAATTFEPEHGGIGPKTYARVFELLLRLKANTLWPAMHECTAPFNGDPRNAALADRYGIVMGSSHAEPMLRNNVREWTAPKPDYSYVTNRAGVLAYWEERARTNGRYEGIWTLGMRGIHDSGIQGARTDAERIAVLEQVFADQRDLLARHVAPAVERVPQMFCAYKEVLDLYRQGLRVPADVTIVWPDDNFGYIRNFASPEERRRPGGFGVYYHISYLGRPLAYLWLNTTPPGLIWSEMTKAHAHGADRIWIVNVGDIKPAEIGTEFFLRLAWDVKQWGPDAQSAFLEEWAAREFGREHAVETAALLGEYYRLNFQRKPEHLQWWLPRQPAAPSPLTTREIESRLWAFGNLRSRADQVAARLRPERQDAWFELVGYPIHGSALANVRYFRGELGQADLATAADAELKRLTARFNEEVAGGKWRGFMRLEPADDDWKSMRIAPWTLPDFPPKPAPDPRAAVTVEAAAWFRQEGAADIVAGLGRSGRAVTLQPDVRLSYQVDLPEAGDWTVFVHLLPTHALQGDALRLGLALDDGPMQTLKLKVADGSPAWAQGVLDGARMTPAKLLVPSAGRHRLVLTGLDAGVAVDRLVLTRGTEHPGYLGVSSP